MHQQQPAKTATTEDGVQPSHSSTHTHSGLWRGGLGFVGSVSACRLQSCMHVIAQSFPLHSSPPRHRPRLEAWPAVAGQKTTAACIPMQAHAQCDRGAHSRMPAGAPSACAHTQSQPRLHPHLPPGETLSLCWLPTRLVIPPQHTQTPISHPHQCVSPASGGPHTGALRHATQAASQQARSDRAQATASQHNTTTTQQRKR